MLEESAVGRVDVVQGKIIELHHIVQSKNITFGHIVYIFTKSKGGLIEI